MRTTQACYNLKNSLRLRSRKHVHSVGIAMKSQSLRNLSDEFFKPTPIPSQNLGEHCQGTAIGNTSRTTVTPVSSSFLAFSLRKAHYVSRPSA